MRDRLCCRWHAGHRAPQEGVGRRGRVASFGKRKFQLAQGSAAFWGKEKGVGTGKDKQ